MSLARDIQPEGSGKQSQLQRDRWLAVKCFGHDLPRVLDKPVATCSRSGKLRVRLVSMHPGVACVLEKECPYPEVFLCRPKVFVKRRPVGVAKLADAERSCASEVFHGAVREHEGIVPIIVERQVQVSE